MSEKLSDDSNKSGALLAGRNALRAAQAAEKPRAATFARFFERSDPTCKRQYLYGRAPIIQPENGSPLANMLLDGLDDGTVALKSIGQQSPRLTDESLQGLCILPLRQVEHQRPYGDHVVPGELDGWFVGSMAVSSLDYGSGVAVLLQPSQVEIRRPENA